MDNLSPSGEALFGTLIAAKNAPFSAPFRLPRSGPDFYPKFGQPPALISSHKRGHFGDTWIAQDFRKISEKSWTIYHHLGMLYLDP